jgi:hypothetical protein
MSCVNHNSKEVTDLARQLGLNPVVVAAHIGLWQELNGSEDVFPNLEQLEDQISDMKVQGRGIKTDDAGYYHEESDIDGENVVPSRLTKATVESHPEIANDMIDDLKRMYPEVIIMKNGILTPDGLFVPIGENIQGLHYRDAFISAVAWANDAKLEVPPHEYAHHYIDMFQNHPLVQKAIARYGKEDLVRYIGRYYLGQKMSSNFTNFLGEFWDMVRSLFGHPNIKKDLAKAFAKGKRLGPESVGTGEVSFMATPVTPNGNPNTKSKNWIQKIKSRFNGSFNTMGNFQEEQANQITPEMARLSIAKELGDPITDAFDDINKRHLLGLTARRLMVDLLETDKINGIYRNADGLSIEEMKDVIKYFDVLDNQRINDIILKLQGNKEIELTGPELEVYDMLIRMQQRLIYSAKISQSYYTDQGKITDRKNVDDSIGSEFSTTETKKAETYKKLKYKWLQNFAKWTESALIALQINKETLSMLMSGGEHTAFTNFFVRAFNNAQRKMDALLQIVDEKLNIITNKPKNFDDWGYISSGKKKIDQLVGREIMMDDGSGPKMVKLTNQELLNIYFILRQTSDKNGNPPPADALVKHGMYFNDAIPGREVSLATAYKISKEDLITIKESIEADPVMKQIIESVNQSTDIIYDAVNKTYVQDMGYDLTKMPNYFPVSFGSAASNVKQRQSKVMGLSSAKTRLGGDKAVLIGDASSVFNTYKNSSILYATHALEISNNRKLLETFKKKYAHDKTMSIYFDQIEGTLNRIENGATIFNSKGESNFENAMNKISSNLAVSALSANIPVLLKQPLSYMAAKIAIDAKYLAKAGWKVGGMVGIKPGGVIKALKYTGVKDGKTMLPVEWQYDENHPSIKEIFQYSPTLARRTLGVINREAGEAFNDQQSGDDKIRIPGTEIYVSKKRLMAGIITMDTVTMASVWEAVKHETEDLHPELVPGSQEYWQHIAGRSEEVFQKTQPTHNEMGRSELETYNNPLARIFTMFGSPRSKLANIMMQDMIRFVVDPSKENRKRMFGTMTNVFIYTGLSLVAIDLLSGMLRGKFDDEDEMLDSARMTLITNNLGTFWGLGELSRMIQSRIDNAPWTANLEHPFQTLVSRSADALGHIYDGDFDKAFFKMGSVVANSTGLPATPLNYTKDFYNAVFKEK